MGPLRLSKLSKYIGKLVVVAHWSDFDLMDATKLGTLEKMEGGYFYIQGDSRGYRHCRPVSQKRLPKPPNNPPLELEP